MTSPGGDLMNTISRLAQRLAALAAILLLTHAMGAGDDVKKKSEWKPLFDGKTLRNWKSTNFGGESEVTVEDGAILMDRGSNMTGVTYTAGDFPKTDYEVALEGKRVNGID